MKNIRVQAVGLGMVIALSFVITASYSLGPDTQTVSVDQYKAMQYVWDQERLDLDNDENHCVLADTFPLLALEGISHKQIIGGGFPINQYFAQPERDQLLKELTTHSNEASWRTALDITKVNTCWLVVNEADFKSTVFSHQYQQEMQKFGTVLVWKYTGPSQSIKNK